MKSLFTLILLIVSHHFLAGGPWLTPKKTGYFELQITLPIGTYNRLFLESGEELYLNRNVLDFNFQAYLEYGITNKLNLITILPYKYISTGKVQEHITNPKLLPDGRLGGFSNYKLAFKYQILNKKLKAALSIHSSFNTISKDLEKGLSTGYNATSIGLKVHIGKSFSDKLYSFIDAGFSARTNNFSEVVDIHYELGYKLKSKLWTALVIDVKESLKNGSYQNENLRQTGFYTNDQEYFAYGLKASYESKNRTGFTFATFGAVTGNYVAFLGTVSIGVYKKW